MSYIHPAWVEHQRKRWMRHDAHRFAPPNPHERKSYAARLVEQWRNEEKQAAAAEQDALHEDFERLRWLVKDLKIDLAIRRLRFKYSPDQPRDELGRWTDAGAADRINDRKVISDETPSNEAIPGAQYAQARGRGAVTVRIGDRTFQLEGGQAARLVEAQSRAESAISRVRELDPSWRPTPSLKETVNGTILSYEAEAREAQARASELAGKGIGPGPFAGESISARGPSRNFTNSEREEINRIGSETGCHTCGDKNGGTPRGNFVVDHQPPSALNSLGRAQQLYPQCLTCSLRQGGWITGRRIGR